MRRFLILLLLLIVPLVCRGDGWFYGGVAAPAGDTYSDILFWWTCESANISTGDYSAGDTSGTLNSAAEINATAAIIGSNGLYVPTGGDYCTFDSTSIFDATSGRIGFWWNYYIATWADDANLLTIDGTTDLYLQTKNGDELRVFWGASTWTSTTANLVRGTSYFIEIAYDADTEMMKVLVNNTEVISSTATAFEPLDTPLYLRFGSYNGGTQFYLDNIMISNDPDRSLYALRSLTASPR